jgi:hypothetical protein
LLAKTRRAASGYRTSANALPEKDMQKLKKKLFT